MRLDATDLRYISNDEFKVLSAVEVGSRNHEVVPTPLIAEVSGVRGGNVNKALGELAKRDLVARVQNVNYDGYRLTYGGLDYLSLKAFSRRKPASVAAVGQKVGVGKESDIYAVAAEGGEKRILKLQRLGRISFRAIKSKRDYLGKRKSASWMYMSRLAAQKEFAFMKVLYANGYPVPVPYDQIRHCIVMSLIDGLPLRAVDEVESPSELYATLMEILVRLARDGLIHGDFNEFNIIIRYKDGQPVIIDFPQMVSTRHANAEFFFNRDVNCIRKFFRKRFRYEARSWPTWKDVVAEDEDEEEEVGEAEASGSTSQIEGEASSSEHVKAEPGAGALGSEKKGRKRLDLEVEASGFGRTMQRELEDYMIDVQDLPESDDSDEDEEDEEEEEEEEAEAREHGPEERINEETEPFDEEEFQKQLAERMEKLRLNRALGNDDPEDLDNGNGGVSSDDKVEEEESSEESSDDDDAHSIAPTDFTTQQRRPRPPRIPKQKLNNRDEMKSVVARQVGKEMEMKAREQHGKKSVNKAGNVKGHKWKKSGTYLVGKNDSSW